MPADAAERALSILRKTPGGEFAAVIGRVEEGSGRVILDNGLGSGRVLDMLTGEQLPRIC